MTQTTNINIRMDSKLKKEFGQFLKKILKNVYVCVGVCVYVHVCVHVVCIWCAW